MRCHWTDGSTTWETQAFLDGLQGNDMATLERANGIAYLEFFVPHPVLCEVTLVDTPGAKSSVPKHEQATAEYQRVATELRSRHDKETQDQTGKADAVNYLTGRAPRQANMEFLSAFEDAMGGNKARAMNALGVLAKLDFSDEIVARRDKLAGKAAERFKQELAGVVPVSAGLKRVLDRWRPLGFAPAEKLRCALQGLDPKLQEFLLSRDTTFDSNERLPLPITERKAIREGIPWSVFALIAWRVAAKSVPPKSSK